MPFDSGRMGSVALLKHVVDRIHGITSSSAHAVIFPTARRSGPSWQGVNSKLHSIDTTSSV